MKSNNAKLALLAALLAAKCNGFTSPIVKPIHGRSRATISPQQQQQHRHPHHQPRFSKADDNEDELERLRSMAAKLRAEAALLEAEQSQAVADAAERAFRKFDTNQDGVVSLEELKTGLEKAFKTELPEKRVKKLMQDFDKTGDGTTLGMEDFVTVDQFRNRLDALAREEKDLARKAADEAKKENEMVQVLQAQLELINEKEPSTTDKIVSVLPYLFPLLDGLQFARFLVLENPDNSLSIAIGIMYALYRAIPFGGLIAFFALSFLSGNLSLNRLVRFNMQQAIFLDIALIVPGLIAGLYSILGKAFGVTLPPEAVELGSDAIFAVLLVTIGYTTVSSMLGMTPNQIPGISSAVESRMPTLDMLKQSGFVDRSRKDDDEKKKDEEKK